MSIRNRQKAPQGRGSSYWIVGIHAVNAALGNPLRQVLRLLAAPQAAEKLVRRKGVQPEIMHIKDMDRRFADMVHQGVALEVKPLDQPALEELLDGIDSGELPAGPLLFLDQVTDPHNVGAILRSAAAFNAAAVIATKDHAPDENATLAKAASGGLDVVPLLQVTNLVQALDAVKKHGYWVAGLDGEAKQTLSEAKLAVKSALVLGAEGKGLRRLTVEHCDLLVKLPIAERMESLNVSNAAAIALYELNRNAT